MLVMFAVRRALSDPEVCRALVADLVAKGAVDPATVADGDDPLGFLVHPDGATSVVDAAYRFARHEPGCDVVLTGTGSVDHLDENVRSITAGPFPRSTSAGCERCSAPSIRSAPTEAHRNGDPPPVTPHEVVSADRSRSCQWGLAGSRPAKGGRETCGDTPAMTGPRKGEADTEGSTDRGVGSRI